MPPTSRMSLKANEARMLRSGVDQVLEGYVKPAEVVLDDIDYTTLPPKGPGDNDLLTASIVQRICEDMAAAHISVAIAGKAVGLPEKLLQNYLDRGNEELSSGQYTRLAWFAVMVNRAEGKVQRSLVGAVIANPLGWMNSLNLLERMWPESFCTQRINVKALKPSGVEEEIRRQLEAARDGDGGAPIPVIDIDAYGGTVIEVPVDE